MFFVSLSLPRTCVAFAFALLFLFAPGTPASAQGEATRPPVVEDIRVLGAGGTVSRKLGPRESHSYRIMLDAGQLLSVQVSVKTNYISFALYDPNGEAVTSDSVFDGSKTLSLVAQVGGPHLLVVRRWYGENESSQYEVRVWEIRSATEEEKTLYTAARLDTQSAQLADDDSREDSGEQAMRLAHQAYQLRRGVLPPGDDRLIKALNELRKRVWDVWLDEEKFLQAHKDIAEVYKEALVDVERRAGRTHLSYAQLLVELSNHYRRGVYLDEAEEALISALETCEKNLGNTHPLTVEVVEQLGSLYVYRGNLKKAESSYLKAIELAQAAGREKWSEDSYDSLNELAGKQVPLSCLGSAYLFWPSAMGDRTAAAAAPSRVSRSRDRSLWIFRRLDKYRLREPTWIARDLNEQGAHSYDSHKYTEALKLFTRALALYREAGYTSGEVVALNNMASAFYALTRYGPALQNLDEAIKLNATLKAPVRKSVATYNKGIIYSARGHDEEAIRLLSSSLSMARESGSVLQRHGALNCLGLALDAVGRHEEAIKSYREVLDLFEGSLRWLDNEAAVTLNNMGLSYLHLGDYDKALKSFNDAFTVQRRQPELDSDEWLKSAHWTDGITLNNLGAVNIALRNDRKAMEFLNAALFILGRRGHTVELGNTLHNLMVASASRGDTQRAIFFGRQAVAVYQAIRLDISGQDRLLREQFARSKTETYRRLAALLISQNQLTEAEQILSLLKLEEYAEFTRRYGEGEAVSASAPAPAPPAPAAARDDPFVRIVSRLGSVNAEYLALREKAISGEGFSDNEHRRFKQLKGELEILNKEFDKFLDQLFEERKRTASAQELQRNVETQTARLQADLRELGLKAADTVTLKTLVTEEKYYVILVTPHARIAREHPIGRVELERKIMAFREMLGNATSNPLPPAQDLYRVLVKPVEDLLEAVKAEMVIWSLDGSLRYMPIAALHDGRRYMVERFRTVVVTPTSSVQEEPQPRWNGLGMGVSKKHEGFDSLPDVSGELEGIVRREGRNEGIWPGALMLDGDFTLDRMLEALRRKYALVHIASHFKINPGDMSRSFLLLGDGSHFSLDSLRREGEIFQGVDLLTLSACQTAVGGIRTNGREIDGLAMMAERGGARSVMASLWLVSDRSTMFLMHRFYEWRNVGLTKAEALRRAQLMLLHGREKLSVNGSTKWNDVIGAEETPGATPSVMPDRRAPGRYGHPYYWAPFVLIGNWK